MIRVGGLCCPTITPDFGARPVGDCYCRAWDEGRVLVILETGHDPGPAHTQPSWIIPCHGVGQTGHDRNDQTKLEEP